MKIPIELAQQLAKDISIEDQYYYRDICKALNKVFDNVKFKEPKKYFDTIEVEEIE